MSEWEQHFNKLQQGLIFDENNSDVTESSENENCNKKLLQNDAGSSHDKLYNKRKMHSPDEYAKNMVVKLRAIPKHANNDTGKKNCWKSNTKMTIFFTKTFNAKKNTAKKRMPKHVLVQPKIYLGFGSKKYH